MSDADGDFNSTDVVDRTRPSRRFYKGGVSPTSALVIYQQGGFVSTTVSVAYVRFRTGWAVAETWIK